ncbi:MAG: hypothetical protein NVSMB2_07460 [Chloroflexota bacterium]
MVATPEPTTTGDVWAADAMAKSPSAAGLATVYALATTIAPASTPTPVPTSVPQAMPSEVAQAPFRVLFDEAFPGAPAGWPNDTQGTAWAVGGYHLTVRRPGEFVALAAPIAEPQSDLIAAASFRKVGGAPGGTYGVIVRDRGPLPRDGNNQLGHFYVAEVNDTGEVAIRRRDNDQWIEVLPWTASPAVNTGGEPNLLAVGSAGPRLAYLVNGVQVGEIADETVTTGWVGVFADGEANDVLVERLIVLVPNTP